ncbi:MAG: protein-glutamate O-methyltransferase CheR [Anaerolineae bacterium]|nr:protein-glutamate O-methyltransferase CheR [Anaerolineae bacterium]
MNDSEFRSITAYLDRVHGLDLSAYKSTAMKRRLEAYLTRMRAGSWAEYVVRLEREPEEGHRLRDYLTISVTSFFRDADRYEVLRREILPELLDTTRSLAAWSAGCSDGPEPYTLAMLFHSLAPRRRVRIWATDIDRQGLARARAGGPYSASAIQLLPSDLSSRYLVPMAGGFGVVPSLVRRVTFQEHDVLRDPISGSFDLIACRNVIIYLTEEARTRLFDRLASSLRPGGVLFVGAAESVPMDQARALGLERLRMSFYRRVTAGDNIVSPNLWVGMGVSDG